MPPQSFTGSKKPGRVSAALGVLLAWLVATPHAGTQAPQVPVAGSAQEAAQLPPATAAQAPLPGPYVVNSDAAVFLFFVRPDREIEFREVVAEMKKAMAASTSDARKAQAAGWKVFRVAEPPPPVPGAPAGAPASAPASVMYAFVISPAVAGSDYSPATLLGEALGPEVGPIWLKYRDAVAAPATRATLSLVADFAR